MLDSVFCFQVASRKAPQVESEKTGRTQESRASTAPTIEEECDDGLWLSYRSSAANSVHNLVFFFW